MTSDKGQLHLEMRIRATVNTLLYLGDNCAEICLNKILVKKGDSSLGTVLHRTSKKFQEIYRKADIVIAKGQAN